MKANPNHSTANSLLIITFFLTSLSLLAIYASSPIKSEELFNTPYYFVQKQLFGIISGFLMVIILQFIPSKIIEHLPLPLVILSLFLLLLIFVPNLYNEVGGSKRWLQLSNSIRFQPAELAKIAIVFFLAKNLSRPSNKIKNWVSGILPNFLLVLLMAVCLLKQPDFGSTALIIVLTIIMLFVAGMRLLHLGIIINVTLVSFVIAIVSSPYRLKRLLSFMDPWSQVSQGGFQIIQSYLAFHNGGFFGLGLGLSKQKLFFLPEAHTDFILSVIAEEMGLFGIISIILLYVFMMILSLRIAAQQTCNFRKLLSFGLSSLISIQALINIGVVSGILPTKGISLPFISCGMSSLLSFLFCIGILARIARETPQENPHHVLRK
jgi:cell division protein FtsW